MALPTPTLLDGERDDVTGCHLRGVTRTERRRYVLIKDSYANRSLTDFEYDRSDLFLLLSFGQIVTESDYVDSRANDVCSRCGVRLAGLFTAFANDRFELFLAVMGVASSSALSRPPPEG